MIFDDLTNIKLYKGIHPNLDQAIDFLYEHRKDSFELGRYDTKMKIIALNIIAVMPTFIY